VEANRVNEVSQYRTKVVELERALKQLPQLEAEMHHHFCQGVYAREMRVPAGTVLTGAIHKRDCINFIMAGSVEVRSEQGAVRLTAPHVFVSPPGTKRAMFVIEDLIWITVHASDMRCIAALERELVVNDYNDLPRLMQESDL